MVEFVRVLAMPVLRPLLAQARREWRLVGHVGRRWAQNTSDMFGMGDEIESDVREMYDHVL